MEKLSVSADLNPMTFIEANQLPLLNAYHKYGI